MDSLDPTERALAERVEIRRQQLREAEEGLELYRREVEIQRQIALDHALALTLQDTVNQERRLLIEDEEDDGEVEEDDDESTLSDFIDEVQVRNDPNQRTCVTCLDDLSDQDAHRCPCRHDWCHTCVVNRYDMAAKSTHLFPAQCCRQPILPDNHELVAPETWARYFEKKTEVETPNPTFCSKRDCSKFIPLQDINEGQAKCVCEHVTCTSCKAEWHDGECVVDPETEQVLRLAREQQWQTCFHCRAMVDRLDGCNEMGTSNMLTPFNQASLKACTNFFVPDCTNCDAKFCYACGKEWKTCPCPQFGRPEPTDQRLAMTTDFRMLPDWGSDWGSEPIGPVGVEDTEALIEERIFQRRAGRWIPRHLRHLEPVVPVEVDNTGVPVEETAVDETAPTATTTTGPDMSLGVTFSGMAFRAFEANRRPRRASTTNSGCDAHSWRRIGGGGTCQSCNASMPNFMFQCRNCRHTSCLRCRQDTDAAR